MTLQQRLCVWKRLAESETLTEGEMKTCRKDCLGFNRNCEKYLPKYEFDNMIRIFKKRTDNYEI